MSLLHNPIHYKLIHRYFDADLLVISDNASGIRGSRFKAEPFVFATDLDSSPVSHDGRSTSTVILK